MMQFVDIKHSLRETSSLSGIATCNLKWTTERSSLP